MRKPRTKVAKGIRCPKPHSESGIRLESLSPKEGSLMAVPSRPGPHYSGVGGVNMVHLPGVPLLL